MGAVLVTVSNGIADFCSAGTVEVVLVDYDQFDRDGVFPEQLDTVIAEVRALPDEIPWKDSTIRTLFELRRKAIDRLTEAWEGGEDAETDEG